MAYIGSNVSMSPTIAIAAGEKIEAGAGKAVKLDSTGRVAVTSAAGEDAIGILILQTADVVEAGETVTVQIAGQGVAMHSTEIKAGQAVMANTTGSVIAATDGKFVIGYALENVTGNAGLIKILIDRGYKPNAAAAG